VILVAYIYRCPDCREEVRQNIKDNGVETVFHGCRMNTVLLSEPPPPDSSTP
jgi:hypothetical protein